MNEFIRLTEIETTAAVLASQAEAIVDR